MKERNHAFDFLCGICIIRMILYHITGFCYMAEEDGWRIVMHWTFFFMSFFFFKAGYFNKTVDGNSWEFTKKKFKQLMIPYFAWGFIGCLVYFTFAWFVLDPRNAMVKSVTVSHIWSTSGFYGNGPCWFLFSFFVAYIAMHLFSKCPSIAFPITHNRSFRIKIHWIVFLFPFVSYLLYEQGNPLWLNLNNVFWGIFLFFLGRVWRVAIERLRPRKMIVLSSIMILAFIALNIIDSSEYTMSSNEWEGNFPVLFAKLILSSCGLSGLFLSFHFPRIPVINYIGQHSMVFFVAHYPVLTFYKMLRSAFVHSIKGKVDDLVIMTILTFVICAWLVPYVEKIPWLSGRFQKKPTVLSEK